MFLSPLKVSFELRKARQKLEMKLLKGDLAYLLDMMDSKELYSDLLRHNEARLICSNYLVSWHARKRASTLYTDQDKRELLIRLAQSDSGRQKQHIYYALSHVCKNRKDAKLFVFLMQQLESETDIKNKLGILSGLGEMDKNLQTPLDPILSEVSSRNNDLKLQAISALRNSQNPTIETFLLRKFKYSRSHKVKMAICCTLESVGSRDSISVLRRSAEKTSDMHYRVMVNQSIDKIKNRVVSANLSVA